MRDWDGPRRRFDFNSPRLFYFNQTGVLAQLSSRRRYPVTLRRAGHRDPETGRKLVFLTNSVDWSAMDMARLNRRRWQIEFLFRWIKQPLRIKAFCGASLNAVKARIWFAICTYACVAFARKRLGLADSLYTILQILSLTLFGEIRFCRFFRRCVRPMAGRSRQPLHLQGT